MVEATANGVEQKLVDALSFRLSPGASYVVNRRSCTFHPQGSNIYESTSGTRLIRIALTGDDWLDPSTLRVSFDVNNKDGTVGKELRVLGGPHTFFQRGRLMCQGVTIEDYDHFGRVSEMLQMLKSKHSRDNDVAEGFGRLWSEHRFHDVSIKPQTWAAGGNENTGLTAGAYTAAVDATPAIRGDIISEPNLNGWRTKRDLRASTFKGIPPSQIQKVLFKPAFGMFSQEKFLPLRYCPLVLELELVSNPLDPIYSTFQRPTEVALDLPNDPNAANVYTKAPIDITADNTSISWSIQNVEVKCDLVTLDNALDNSYADHLLSGKSLPINYQTFSSQMQTILNMQKPNVNVTRALTRLKTVFVTLDKTIESFERPGAKPWNTFWSPMSLDNSVFSPTIDTHTFAHNAAGEFTFGLQLGSKKYPEYDIQAHSEAMYQLKKALGIQSSDVHSFDINARQYRDQRCILAIDMEKVLGASYTGTNTRAGDLLSVKYEYKTADNARFGDRMQIVLHSDQIMEIRDGGVQIFD